MTTSTITKPRSPAQQAHLRRIQELSNETVQTCPDCGRSIKGAGAYGNHILACCGGDDDLAPELECRPESRYRPLAIFERIVCPECRTVQGATVTFDGHMPVRVHWCVNKACGHRITESEWEEASDGHD